MLDCFSAEPKASACQLSKRWLRLAKILGTSAGAPPELLAGVGGILVKQKDPQDMTKAIEQVCQLSDAE
jgi:hypothetical protein